MVEGSGSLELPKSSGNVLVRGIRKVIQGIGGNPECPALMLSEKEQLMLSEKKQALDRLKKLKQDLKNDGELKEKGPNGVPRAIRNMNFINNKVLPIIRDYEWLGKIYLCGDRRPETAWDSDGGGSSGDQLYLDQSGLRIICFQREGGRLDEGYIKEGFENRHMGVLRWLSYFNRNEIINTFRSEIKKLKYPSEEFLR